MRKTFALFAAALLALPAWTAPALADSGVAQIVYVGPASGLPKNCWVGQAAFATDATAGQNLNVCSSGNTWTTVSQIPVASTSSSSSLSTGNGIIAPSTPVILLTGPATNVPQTITVPTTYCLQSGCTVTFIPEVLFTTSTAGNIAIASTSVTSKALIMTYEPTTLKWYPSY